MVSTPASDPVSNADEFALQAFERLQEAASFVRDFTGRQMSRMKQYYDSSVKPVSFADGEKVLVYIPRKKRGHFAKWAVSWLGPVVVQRKLNESNYVVRKGKGKSVVIHVDACTNCLFLLWMVSHLLSHLIRTRTLERTMKPLFCLASGVGHSLLQKCLAFTPRGPRTAVTGEIAFRL